MHGKGTRTAITILPVHGPCPTGTCMWKIFGFDLGRSFYSIALKHGRMGMIFESNQPRPKRRELGVTRIQEFLENESLIRYRLCWNSVNWWKIEFLEFSTQSVPSERGSGGQHLPQIGFLHQFQRFLHEMKLNRTVWDHAEWSYINFSDPWAVHWNLIDCFVL